MAVNTTVNGVVSAPTDVDYFVFEGRKGQRVLVSCLASSIDSRLRAAVELLALLLSASSLEALLFSPAAIISFRVVAFLVFAALVGIGLVLPLRRHVTDTQVALYLEECDPTLEAAILSAVETSGSAGIWMRRSRLSLRPPGATWRPLSRLTSRTASRKTRSIPVMTGRAALRLRLR